MKKQYLKLGVGFSLFIFLSKTVYLAASYFTLTNLTLQQEFLTRSYQTHPIETVLTFISAYITLTTLCVPGATVLTLAAGSIFGLGLGTLVVLLSSTTGATFAFLISRTLFKNYIQNRFRSKLTQINEGVRKEGGFFLLTLRIVPIFPYVLVNLLMAVTPIRTATFSLISLIGMLPGTLAYVNAGKQLSQIRSPQGVLTPKVLLSLAALGLLPLFLKRLIEYIQKRVIMNRFPKFITQSGDGIRKQALRSKKPLP